MKLVACRVGLHLPVFGDEQDDGELLRVCAICGDVDVERRLRLPRPPRPRLRWPLARRSRLASALARAELAERRLASCSYSREALRENLAALQMERIRLRREVDDSRTAIGYARQVIERVTSIEKKMLDGEGDCAEIRLTIIAPAFPDAGEREVVAAALAAELAAALERPGSYRRTLDRYTATETRR